MDIYAFQRALTAKLAAWAGLNLLAGGLLNLLPSPFWRGFGQQAIGWGAVNAAIALFGRRSLEKRLSAAADAAAPTPPAADAQTQEAANLARLLWLNAGLDLLYIAGGALLAGQKGRADRRAAGHGWGIVLQGAFLFIFDLVHAAALRDRADEQR